MNLQTDWVELSETESAGLVEISEDPKRTYGRCGGSQKETNYFDASIEVSANMSCSSASSLFGSSVLCVRGSRNSPGPQWPF